MKDIDNKRDYVRNRVLNGHAPHNLLKKKMYEAFRKDEDDIFHIDRIAWRELSNVSERGET